MEARKKKRGFLSRKAIRFVCIIFPACSLTILFLAVYWLPELTYRYKELRACSSTRIRFFTENQPLCKLGEMMIAMLPQDLAFTVLVLSERAFECDLRLHLNISLSSDKVNDTDVVITRVLSFSTIPALFLRMRWCLGLNYDSLSGFTMHILNYGNQRLDVNSRSERFDMRRGEILEHVMDGLLMDIQQGAKG